MTGKEIYLSEEEQVYLKSIVRKGVHNSHVITRARVLLMLDRTGKSDHVRYSRTAEYAEICEMNFLRPMTSNPTSTAKNAKLRHDRQSWMEPEKLKSSLSRAASLRKAAPGGQFVFWLKKSCSLGLQTKYRT